MKNEQRLFEHLVKPNLFHTQTILDINLEELFNKIDYTSSAFGRQFFYKHLFEKHNSIPTDIIQNDFIQLSTKNNSGILKELEKCNNEDDYHVIDSIINSKHKFPNTTTVSLFSTILLIIGLLGLIIHFSFAILILISITLNVRSTSNCEKSFHEQINTYCAISRFINLAYLVSDVKTNAFKKELKKPRSRFLRLNFLFSESAIYNYASKSIFNLIRIIIPIDRIAYKYYITHLNSNTDYYIHTFQKIGYFDLINSIVEIQNNYQTCIPMFNDSCGNMKIIKGYHPLIEEYKTHSYIPVKKDSIITGGIMSGKSTFLKQIALNTIIGQKLGICFASEAFLPTFPVCTFMNSTENLLGGVSHFYSHLTRMKNIMQSCLKEKHIVIIDNTFKSANSSEQVAINYGIIKEISKLSHILVTTSDDDNLIKLFPNFNLYHINRTNFSDKKTYSGEIVGGTQLKNNTIDAAEELGMPNSVLENAKQLHQHINLHRKKAHSCCGSLINISSLYNNSSIILES
ncbi:MutS-related protein [Saccharicrinis aurantiacus]|uniref:MutS-related protein n=1 Tax=Saccharicrinis aurantiacus TaxID=1849719 RepID=UPI0024920708|nr:hypothetical protein [Saccharicrinis aurantiacus]